MVEGRRGIPITRFWRLEGIAGDFETVSLNPRSAPDAQLSQALRATICSTPAQGRRANSLRSNMRDSVGLLRGPQTLTAPCFEAATDARRGRCGGSGYRLSFALQQVRCQTA